MASPHEQRRERRPAWARLALGAGPVVVPLVLPLLLLAGVLAWSLARDADPGGLGEPETGLVPGAVTVTGWHQADVSLVPDGFGRGDPGHASPRALIDTMIAQARQAADGAQWITGEILSEDADAARPSARARVYLPLPDFSTAFVAAEQVLELAVKSDGWYVDDSNVRFHCSRAVRDAVCG
jgi:hypothetical protein